MPKRKRRTQKHFKFSYLIMEVGHLITYYNSTRDYSEKTGTPMKDGTYVQVSIYIVLHRIALIIASYLF